MAPPMRIVCTTTLIMAPAARFCLAAFDSIRLSNMSSRSRASGQRNGRAFRGGKVERTIPGGMAPSLRIGEVAVRIGFQQHVVAPLDRIVGFTLERSDGRDGNRDGEQRAAAE